MTPNSFLLWLGEASLAFGAVVLLLVLLRGQAQRRFGAGWTYALWLAPMIALAATLAPSNVIELQVLPASAPASATPQPYPPSAEFLFPLEADLVQPSAAPAEPFSFDFAALLTAFWAVGALASLGLFALSHLRFHRTVVASARRAKPAELPELFALTTGTPLLAARDIRFTDQLASPTAYGLLRPLVLLPASFLDAYDESERRVMILHEAEHVRARHLPHRCLARLVRALFWFHPLAWLGERSFIVDQELACDQAVLRRNQSIRPRAYAATLLKTASRIAAPGVCSAPGHKVAAPLITIKQLKERTAMLERHVTASKARVAGAVAAFGVATAALFVGFTGSIAATDREAPDPDEIAAARDAVAEAREVLRERQAELRELLVDEPGLYWFDSDGEHSFQFVLPEAPDAPFAPNVPSVLELIGPQLEGFGHNYSYSFSLEDLEDGLDEEAVEAFQERMREQAEAYRETLEAFQGEREELAERLREEAERARERAGESAARAAEAVRERAERRAEQNVRERRAELDIVRPESGELFIAPRFFTERENVRSNNEELEARLEALEEQLGQLDRIEELERTIAALRAELEDRAGDNR